MIATHFLAHSCKQLFLSIFLEAIPRKGYNSSSKVTLQFIYKPKKDFIRKYAVYKECAKKWVAIRAGTLLCCIYFSMYILTFLTYKFSQESKA